MLRWRFKLYRLHRRHIRRLFGRPTAPQQRNPAKSVLRHIRSPVGLVSPLSEAARPSRDNRNITRRRLSLQRPYAMVASRRTRPQRRRRWALRRSRFASRSSSSSLGTSSRSSSRPSYRSAYDPPPSYVPPPAPSPPPSPPVKFSCQNGG